MFELNELSIKPKDCKTDKDAKGTKIGRRAHLIEDERRPQNKVCSLDRSAECALFLPNLSDRMWRAFGFGKHQLSFFSYFSFISFQEALSSKLKIFLSHFLFWLLENSRKFGDEGILKDKEIGISFSRDFLEFFYKVEFYKLISIFSSSLLNVKQTQFFTSLFFQNWRIFFFSNLRRWTFRDPLLLW